MTFRVPDSVLVFSWVLVWGGGGKLGGLGLTTTIQQSTETSKCTFTSECIVLSTSFQKFEMHNILEVKRGIDFSCA